MNGNDADKHNEDSARESRLGRLLAEAKGFAVVGSDGEAIGTLAYLRYERFADRPDEVVIRRRGVRRREIAVPFQSVASIDLDQRLVILDIPAQAASGPSSSAWRL